MKVFFSRRGLIACVFLCALLGLRAGTAHAFSVSPVTIDLEVAPGASAQSEMRITNTSDDPKTYYVTIQKFVANGEEGQQEFLPETDVTGIASWILPERRSVTLKPHETASFAYVVKVPKEAEPGGHFAALFFSNQPNTKEGRPAIGVGAKVGVLFLVRVPGDIKEDARVESFRVTDAGRLSRLPAHFELRIRNLGSVHFRPQGSIVIKNIFGSIAAKVPMNPRQGAVLPNSVRRLDAAWTKTSQEQMGGFFSELANEWTNFAIGRYTAEVQGTYGSTNRPITASATFWVIPWRIMLMGALLLIVLLSLVKGYNQMVIHAAIAKVPAKRR